MTYTYLKQIYLLDKSTTTTVGLGLSLGVLTSILINYLQKKKVEQKKIKQEEVVEANTGDVTLYEDEDAKKRKFIQELIKNNKSKYKEFNRLKIKDGVLKGNTLLDEIKFLDSAICEIEKVPNLIVDLV